MKSERFCVGPALIPNKLKCPYSKNGFHEYEGKTYDGIKNWRCPECFKKHLIRVHAENPESQK